MGHALNNINRVLYIISAILMFILAWVIVVDVVGRGVFNSPLTGTHEIVSNTIVAIAYLQLSYSIEVGGMLRSEVLVSRLPPRIANFMTFLRHLAGAVVFGLIVYAAWNPTLHAWEIREYFGAASFRYPTYPVRTVLVVCCALAFLVYLMQAWQALRGTPKQPRTN